MTTLPSQIGSATVAAIRTNITQLRNNATYPGFKKTFLNHCHLNHGQVGQDLITGITTKVEPLGNRPHYSDELIHPVTNEKIHGSRKYERERPPQKKNRKTASKALHWLSTLTHFLSQKKVKLALTKTLHRMNEENQQTLRLITSSRKMMTTRFAFFTTISLKRLSIR